MKAAHKSDCKRIFRRYDPDCPRCQELAAGAAPRKPWFEKPKYPGLRSRG